MIFGEAVPLPAGNPTFTFGIPKDGSLPLDGAVPSLIDHHGDSSYIATIPDPGARLVSMILEHPDPVALGALYRALDIDRPPAIIHGPKVRYRALIETPAGLKNLT